MSAQPNERIENCAKPPKYQSASKTPVIMPFADEEEERLWNEIVEAKQKHN